MLVFSDGQTLYHKETAELVKLTVAVAPGKNVTMISAEGRVYVDNIDNYAPIIDEFGVVHHGFPKLGEHVDFTLRKYIDSMQKRKLKYAKKILGRSCRSTFLEELDEDTFITRVMSVVKGRSPFSFSVHQLVSVLTNWKRPGD